MGKNKLFAILHDGTLDGDSVFFCPEDKVPYHGETVKELCEARYNRIIKDETDGLEGDELQEAIKAIKAEKEDDVKGAWIVDQKTIKIVDAIWESVQPGCDSAAYACNRAAKAVVNQLAIKKLGKRPRLPNQRIIASVGHVVVYESPK